MFYAYSITTFNKADDVSVPMAEAPIIIQNEPILAPEVIAEVPVEISVSPEVPTEILTGVVEVISGVAEITTEVVSGILAPTEQATGEILSGEIMTGEILIPGKEEFFSGVLNDLSGEVMYNLSGNIIGQVNVQSGNIIPTNMSGVSLLTQSVSTIYSEQQIKINGSGYIQLDSFESVITTGGEIGATYCSRITYENISSILKAGIWTWRETNDYVMQGDTQQILNQAIIDYTVLELTGDQMQILFSGNKASVYGSVYDVYITFISNGEKVYHRITVIYGDDEQRYVLDPLRGAKTKAPQKIADYIGYYNDEIDVQRYIGQAYSPVIIKTEFTKYENITPLFQELTREEILTGVILTGEINSGEVITGEQIISTGIIETGIIIPEVIPEVISTGTNEQPILVTEAPALGGSEALQSSSEIIGDILTGVIEILTGEEIVTGYFDQAYNKGIYDDKIINLQKMFARLQIYSGVVDGVYSDEVISAIYTYQQNNGLLIGQENNKAVRGYLGPKTRKYLNATYVEYQMYEFSLLQEQLKQQEQNILTGEISISEILPTTTTGIDQVIIPITGQETLNTIGTLSGVNTIVLFDPLANPLLFSGLLNVSGYQSLLSGFVYTKGAQIGLIFSGTKKEIITYLRSVGYETGSITLVAISNSQTLVGDTKLSFADLSGMLLVPVILQSTNDLSGNIAEVSMPEGVILKTADGENFTGELAPPVFLDPTVVEQQVDQEVISVIDVGSDQSVSFEDSGGNAMYATFRVPAPGMNIGDTIDVNYSEDGINRIFMNSVNVQNIDGEPYAIFEASHFTTFYLGNTTGTFVINNDTAYTTGLSVTLNSNVTGASQMRFGNTIAERDAASWVSYATGYTWNLTGLYSGEVKRVYAQFSGNDVVRNVSDSIVYDINSGVNASGLQLHLNASTGGTRFYDIGYRNLFFTGMVGAYKSTWSGEEIMVTDGVNDYIEGTSGFVTNYPFTISAWVKPNRVNVIQTLVMFGDSATNTTSYGIRLDASGKPNAVAQNTTAISAVSTTVLVPGRWYHIIGVFNSSTSRTIYVDNNNPVTNTSTGTFSATNQRRRIGRYPGLSTTNYYSGAIDEVRVYNKTLTAEERQAIFMVPPTFDTQTAFTGTPTLYGSLGDKMYLPTLVISGITYTTTADGTGKWKTNPMVTGLANDTYNVTINYTNVYGKTGTVIYTNGLVVNTTGVNVTYDPVTATTGNVIATLTGLDPTYMIVNNSGSELKTFTGNGSFTWQYVDKQGTTGSTTATVDWIKSVILTYSTGVFYENSLSNNGSIAGNIIATLSTGAFSGVAANYITMTNLPAGLTGVYTLSGTNKIIITLSGNATNHGSINSVSNITISFATGAFVNMNPSDIGDSTKTAITISFYDAPGYIAGQQLRVNGTLSGGIFYDLSPNNRVITGVNVANDTRSGENIMSFNNTSSYVDIGSYTLSNYTISAWFKATTFDSFDTIIGNGDALVSSYELIDIYGNKVTFYSHGSTFQSAETIVVGKWYHVALVQNSTGTSMYINGVFDKSTTARVTLSEAKLAIGTDLSYDQYRNGNIDEVKIYDSAITATQVANLYMNKPSFVTKTANTDTPTLTGLAPDTLMALSLVVSGTNYSVTNNGNGTRTSSSIGPLSSGTYNVQLNYTNVYGRTGMLIYTGGLIVDLSGVNILPRASITYAPGSGTYTTGNVIVTLTGFNKTGITITNNSGLATYTFTGNGSFTFQFADSIGATGSATATVDWIRKAVLTYSTGVFYEDSTTNTGSITGNIIATLSTGSFSGVAANYITMTNIPSGLTGVYTLSGTQQVIITLSGKAINHTSANNISNITLSFGTGAFINMNPSDVEKSTQTGIAIEFYDVPGYIAGQQLRINGTLSGGQFYDWSSNHRATTIAGALSNSVQSGETVMGPFNGTTQYVSIGTYTLSNYTISAWFKTSRLGSWGTIVGQDGGTALEISQNTANKVNFYDISSSFISTTTIAAGQWYHMVRVQSGTNTYMYINGVLETSGVGSTTINGMALAIGKYSTSQYRSGNIDEVKIYDSAVTETQVQSLYMTKPSFVAKTVNTGTTTLTGVSDDTTMALSLVVSGTNYSVTNNGNGTRTSNSIGPLSSGTYNVQLNYTNTYGKTGMLMYTGGLIVTISVADTTPPSIPVLILPADGAISTTGMISLLRSGSIDTGAGLSGYLYQVATNIGFTSFALTGTIPTTGKSISLADGTYYRRIAGYDVVGNAGGRSSGWSFTIDTTPPPSITGISIVPNLNAGYFGDYTLTKTISGSIISGSFEVQGINGDGGNCIDYYASGTCVPDTDVYTSTFSGGQIRQTTGVRPDALYPQIYFAPSALTRNNAPSNLTTTRNAYSLLHMQNNFSMQSGTNFWIEINTLRRSTTSVNLSVYIVEKGHNTTYFNTSWLAKTGVELVGTITSTTVFNHQHTANAAHNLIALSTNADGTIGTKHLNISGDFWIVLYPNTTTTSRGWDLRYQPSSLCTNTNGWYVGNQGAGWTTILQAGCPDTHIHMVRKETKVDGVNVVAKVTYTGALGIGQISGFKNFYFGPIPNMAPNATSFIIPTSGDIYNSNVSVSWNPATDPNNDALTYNMYLLDSTGAVLQTLITGTSLTDYLLKINVGFTDGIYGLKGEVCDNQYCIPFTTDDNFIVDKTAPTFTGISSGSVYSGDITINFSDANLSGAILSGIDTSYYSGNFNTGTISLSNGIYKFTVYDRVGNTTGAIFTINTPVPDIVNELLSGGYQLSGSMYVGTSSIDFGLYSGNLLYPTILQSSNTLLGDMAQVYIPAGAVLKVVGGAGFTGILTTPVFQDETSISVSGQTILSLMDIGNSQNILFFDTGGKPLDVTFTMPAPGMNIGDSVQVRYSYNGTTRLFENYAEVQDIGGQTYVVFTANHFTQFYLGAEVGTFAINNDAAYATGLAVTLNNNVSGATQMRFGNSIAERNGTGWKTYTTGYSWNLTGVGGDGLKRVYAQFSGGGYTMGVSDSIILDTSSGAMASGLQLHLDGSTGGVVFTDIGPRGLIFTGMNGAYKTTWSGETIMGFNGTSQYIQNTSGFISGYPFTISARVKPSAIGAIQTITAFGNSTNNNVYYEIRLNAAGNAVAIASNTTTASATSTAVLTANKRYHIVGVFATAADRKIYVDAGTPVQNTTSRLFSGSNPRRTVGRRAGSTTTNFFSGNIDEVRVYGSALTASEISGLYMTTPSYSPLTTFTGTPTLYGTLPSKIYDVSLVISGNTYTTTGAGNGLWKTNAFTTGLSAGTYNVVMNYTNVYGKTGSITYTSGLIINLSGPTITYLPASGTITTGSVVATLTGMDPTYMIVNNSGNANYTFTTNTGFTYQFIDQVGTTGYITASVDWIRLATLTYSTLHFYENTGTNNGSITGNIVVTLGTGAFSGNIVSNNYVTLTNVPAGLTGAFVLSGTNQLIVSLSGNATNHSISNDTGNLIITFLTGAFVNMNPTDVIGYIQTGIAVHFYDVTGYISGQQLRIDGSYIGNRFYDISPINHLTTGFNVTTDSQSGETVMSFNNASSYIDIGAYSLSNYTISAWFKANTLASYDTIIGNGNAAVSTYEMIDVYNGKIDFYSNGGLLSTETIVTGQRYHVALVQTSTGTQMYVNGVFDKSNASVTTLTNAALAIGADLRWSQWRDGNIDEVKIYDSAITATQVQNLYMTTPSFAGATKTISVGNTVILTGLSADTQMALSLTISGTTYPVTNNQNGTRTSSAIGPLTGGTYNVQLNYTNVYGKTGMLMYTGGLVININWNIPSASVTYTPSSDTTGNVVATLTGFNQTGITITNNSGNANYTFTGNGSFTYEFINGLGYTGSTTATVTWIKKSILNYSTTTLYEDMPWNNGSVAGNIVVTLSTGSFSGGAVNYITLTNLPTGLTGAYVLSGTNKVIITLSGQASSNAAANSISGLIINFLSGAFVNMSSDDVRHATKTGLSITFYDANPAGGMYATDDVVLDADNAEANGCGAGLCQEYNYGQTTYGGVSDFGSKMLIKFNVAANVPAGATITSATLRLGKNYLGGGAPTDDGTGFKLRKIINNPGWIEGSGSTTIALTGEPNYKQRKWNQENWNNGDPGLIAGVDYGTTDLMDSVGFTGSATASYTQTFTLNSAGIAAIQDWLYNSGNNQGFGIVEANKNWIYIYSDEDTTASNRPYLTVNYIADTTAPQISSVTPLDNSNGVALDLHPNIIFSEHVSPVSGKNIYIKKSVDNSIIETINVGNVGLVSVNDTLVIVYPTINLSSNTGYYIQIESGAFVDRANNAFTGITDTTTWNFITVDTTSVPNVITPSISGLEYTTVTLGGTITSTGSSSVKEFGIVWGTVPGFNTVGANKLSQTGTRNFTGDFSLGIAGFTTGATIYFRAFAANDQGTGYSSESGFTLKPDTVRFGTATMLSNDTFTVNRFGVTGANHYELYLSTGSACVSYIAGYNPIILTGTSYKFINLERETTYYYKMYSVNSGGTSPVSIINTTATSFLPRPRTRLKFEESAGAVAYDSSENYNYGVISGSPIMQRTGADGKAYNFDGIDDFVSVTDIANMDPSLTISFWFKTNTTGNNQHIFSRGNDTGTNSINVMFDQASGSLKTFINGSQNILNVTGALYTGLLNNQRHFYSLTIDNDGAVSGKKLATVFLDGVTKLTNSTLNSGAFDPTTNIFVGRRSENSAGTYFRGDVDDFRLYGKILTPPEINNIYLMFADTVKPTASVTYTPGSGSATSGSVVATLTGASEIITITNNGGLSGYTFTGNGTFTFTFRDEGFNTGEVTASVYWINPIFTSITGANTNTVYTSNVITLTGYGAGVTTGVSITTGTLYKNGIAVGQSATGGNNDQFSIQLTSSSGNMETISSTMTIGITSGIFTVTTKNIGIYLSGPASFDFGMRTASDTIYTIEKTFSGVNDYFKVIDNAGEDTGYYTTISISNMATVSGDNIPYTAIAVKSLTGIVALSGINNPRVYSAITGTYQYFTALPLTFIRRDTATNSGLTGTYGLQTIWKIDVPALQNVGNYTGVITYTLY